MFFAYTCLIIFWMNLIWFIYHSTAAAFSELFYSSVDSSSLILLLRAPWSFRVAMVTLFSVSI